jgi:Protein of unknown function (DUF3467)
VSDEPEQPETPALQLALPPEITPGVWSNVAAVSHSPYEFTINFGQIDFSQPAPTGIVVARVHMSPLMVSQLIEALQTNWLRYAERAMPREVYSGDNDPTDDGPAQ